MDLREVWWEVLDWIHLSQNKYQHNNGPLGSIRGGEFLDLPKKLSDSQRLCFMELLSYL